MLSLAAYSAGCRVDNAIRVILAGRVKVITPFDSSLQKLEGLPNGAGSARAFVCVITENGKRVWTTFAAFSKENKLHTFMYGGQTGNGFRLWFEGKKG